MAEHLNAPVTTTDEGKGSINETHPLALGSANYGANSALSQADVVLIIGSRLSPRRNQRSVQTNQRIIQIDIDADEIGRNHPVQVGIVGAALPGHYIHQFAVVEILPYDILFNTWTAHRFISIWYCSVLVGGVIASRRRSNLVPDYNNCSRLLHRYAPRNDHKSTIIKQNHRKLAKTLAWLYDLFGHLVIYILRLLQD